MFCSFFRALMVMMTTTDWLRQAQLHQAGRVARSHGRFPLSVFCVILYLATIRTRCVSILFSSRVSLLTCAQGGSERCLPLPKRNNDEDRPSARYSACFGVLAGSVGASNLETIRFRLAISQDFRIGIQNRRVVCFGVRSGSLLVTF